MKLEPVFYTRTKALKMRFQAIRQFQCSHASDASVTRVDPAHVHQAPLLQAANAKGHPRDTIDSRVTRSTHFQASEVQVHLGDFEARASLGFRRVNSGKQMLTCAVRIPERNANRSRVRTPRSAAKTMPGQSAPARGFLYLLSSSSKRTRRRRDKKPFSRRTCCNST